MKKINIIQFMPYFPPHKWWVETVWQEIGKYWCKNNYWSFTNVIFDIWQLNNNNYELDWYKVILLPSFDIIPNFPFPKFWNKQFWNVFKELKLLINSSKQVNDNIEQNYVVITHTRFFLSSYIWWLFSRKNKLKWLHIEHWSDYVKLWSKIKSKISYFYDRLIWKWIFKKCDKIIAISWACKNFILNEFITRDIDIIYRWLDNSLDTNINTIDLKEKFPWKIIIWFVWRILKWKNVDSLINAYYLLNDDIKNKIQIVIVWDWEELINLKNIDKNNQIYFTWSKWFNEALLIQKQFDIHFHTSSPWWWLATTLLQAMYLWCFIIATPYEWANEVIDDSVNWILLENDFVESIKKWIEKWIENLDKKNDYSIVNTKIISEKFNRNTSIEKIYKVLNNI